MPVSVDNTIERASNDGGTSVTSGTFDVVTDDLIVVTANCDENADVTLITFAISDNQTPDLSYTQIAQRARFDGTFEGGVSAWYHRVVSNITGLTITIAVSKAAPGITDSPSIKVYKATGYDTSTIVGAQTENGSTTNNLTTASITPQTSGAGFAVGTEWQELGVPTSSDLTFSGFDTAGDISGGSGYKTLSEGVGATANLDAFGDAAAQWNYLWFEIRTAAAGGATHPGWYQSRGGWF